ncbi:hypothetical protein [Pseudodesulfovibrio indicus]|jgi:hypothetical protein|uniref:Uncharacterized protein n=1 Tax=Pseudodesulfovibrio indicus TaxID=1716143 RepID=A0A126QK75_9BACT|nr:hypothetical protein [Pseudodesulfovibrio indicus]AMK10384.1 hypothetical protein AWY79_04265 [Pseudodesulfovibrio indicus]TDT89229.1 hypothetical protein EDC59_104222 [Pseudodesulfovibrio indicus]
MKIRPDQIEGVQPEQSQRKGAAKQTDQAFGDLLNQEVARGESAASPQYVAPPQIVNPLIAAGAVAQVQPAADTGEQVAGQVESILDKWDSYAATLADPQAGLKSAYGTLDEIAGEVAAIKAEQPDLGSTHPGLQSIVEELETLTAAEQFKFNRGDYV